MSDLTDPADPADPADKSEAVARADRLARAIAADIAAFHEPIVAAAIARDAFFEDLAAPLDEGMALYRSRVGAEVDPASAHFWRAVLQVILAPRGHIASPMW